MNLAVNALPDLIDNRFIWLPQYSFKFTAATNELTGYFNTAYAYCNFFQWSKAIEKLTDSSSSAGQGRMIARIVTSLTDSWWFNTNCIVDGMLGQNYYDIGNCGG